MTPRRPGRLRRRAQARALAILPYGWARPIVSGLSRSRLLHATVFARHRRRLRRAEPWLGPGFDPRVECSRLVFAAWARRWHLIDLAMRPAASHAWLEIHGLAHFEQAASRGPVLLLSSHFGSARVVPLLLALSGQRLLSLESADYYARLGLEVPALEVEPLRAGEGAFPPRAAVAAFRRLREGGVVHMTGDGRVGRPHLAVGFCGRTIEVRSSFAQLAVDAGAAVVMAVATVDERGRVRVEFLPPLDSGAPTQPRQERIDGLVRAYWRELEQRWRSDPGNIPAAWIGERLFATGEA